MQDNPSAILSRYLTVWDRVEGWVGPDVYLVLQWIERYFSEQPIPGDIAEIGVHHGKFLLSLGPLLNSGERAIAIDIWEDQHLNVDSSGQGSSSIFLQHCAEIAPEMEVRLIAADSLSLSAADIRREMSGERIKFFSVDGGHTPQHVVNDLRLAQDLIAPGGIVALDDFLGPLWPTVTEGFFDYFEHHNYRLSPFLIFQNKLWLTTHSEQADVLQRAKQHFEQTSGEDWHTRFRSTTFKGHQVLGFSKGQPGRPPSLDEV